MMRGCVSDLDVQPIFSQRRSSCSKNEDSFNADWLFGSIDGGGRTPSTKGTR